MDHNERHNLSAERTTSHANDKAISSEHLRTDVRSPGMELVASGRLGRRGHRKQRNSAHSDGSHLREAGIEEVATTRTQSSDAGWDAFATLPVPKATDSFVETLTDFGSKRSSARGIDAWGLEELLRSDIFSVVIAKMLLPEDLANLAM